MQPTLARFSRITNSVFKTDYYGLLYTLKKPHSPCFSVRVWNTRCVPAEHQSPDIAKGLHHRDSSLMHHGFDQLSETEPDVRHSCSDVVNSFQDFLHIRLLIYQRSVRLAELPTCGFWATTGLSLRRAHCRPDKHLEEKGYFATLICVSYRSKAGLHLLCECGFNKTRVNGSSLISSAVTFLSLVLGLRSIALTLSPLTQVRFMSGSQFPLSQSMTFSMRETLTSSLTL